MMDANDLAQVRADFFSAFAPLAVAGRILRPSNTADAVGAPTTVYADTAPPQTLVECIVSDMESGGGMNARQQVAGAQGFTSWVRIAVPWDTDVQRGDRVELANGNHYEVRDFGEDDILGISKILLAVRPESHR